MIINHIILLCNISLFLFVPTLPRSDILFFLLVWWTGDLAPSSYKTLNNYKCILKF